MTMPTREASSGSVANAAKRFPSGASSSRSSWKNAAPEMTGIGGDESRSKHMRRRYSYTRPVDEERFEVDVERVVLRGHRGGEGAPALLLHGGAAVPDYLGECAALLDGLYST